VQALLRRAESRRRPARLRVDDLEIDSAARVVPLRGAPEEVALVRSLASDPIRVLTKDDGVSAREGRGGRSGRAPPSQACYQRA
jgi:DNA-binding response OmpR family regulator